MSGDYTVGDTLHFYFTSRDGTGLPTTLSGTPAVSVYEDASATEITAGVTLAVDHDSRTGLNRVQVVASGANGYGAGQHYHLVITAGTVDSISVVGEVVGQFTLQRSAAAVDLANGTDGLGAIKADTAATLVDTAVIGAAGAGLTAVPWNSAWDAEVQSEVQDAIVANGLDHLVAASVAGTDVVDNSIVARLVSSASTADFDTYDQTTDSLQALRDRGDAAWTTGGGGSISDILQWKLLVPPAIDLANTKSYRLAIALTNQLDDLPTTTEITPGTISIDRAAQGGTTWASVVTDAACSELAGLIYFDEVFDTATGYQAGDMLRITFKGQRITVSANDYEIADGTHGIIAYTGIVAQTPDVNIAQINGNSTAAATIALFAAALDQGTGQIDNGTFASGSITATTITDGALTSAKFADNYLTAAKVAADVTTELQAGLATAAALATVDANVDAILVDTGTTLPAVLGTPAGASLAADVAAVQTTADAIETDTQNIQTRIPAALSSNGNIPADMQEINNVPVTGNGTVGNEFSV